LRASIRWHARVCRRAIELIRHASGEYVAVSASDASAARRAAAIRAHAAARRPRQRSVRGALLIRHDYSPPLFLDITISRHAISLLRHCRALRAAAMRYGCAPSADASAQSVRAVYLLMPLICHDSFLFSIFSRCQLSFSPPITLIFPLFRHYFSPFRHFHIDAIDDISFSPLRWPRLFAITLTLIFSLLRHYAMPPRRHACRRFLSPFFDDYADISSCRLFSLHAFTHTIFIIVFSPFLFLSLAG
jgi:hypothetical protein